MNYVNFVFQEESEEKKQKRLEKEVRNMRNKIRYLKEKQDHMKRERMGFKMSLKNQQAALKSVTCLTLIYAIKKAYDFRYIFLKFYHFFK